MPRKILFKIFSFVFCYLLFVHPLLAQSPTVVYTQTCDLCGWCAKDTNPAPPANWNQCSACIYQDYANRVLKPNSYYTVFGCLSTKPEFFVKSILSIVFGIAGGIAFLSVLWGSGIVLTSSGDPTRLQNGKDLITSSLLGILLIVFSIFLLRMVGFDILRIPGFG